MIESPAITVTGFLVCALFPGPDCSSFSFFSGFLSLGQVKPIWNKTRYETETQNNNEYGT